MTPTQTHAALLISLKDSDFWPADMSLNKWADLVCDELRRLDAENQRLQALLAKLQPTQEPAQAGELSEPDADFLTRCERTDELIEYVKAYARAALAARKPLTMLDHDQVIRAMTESFPTPSLVPMLKGSVICGDFHKALVSAVNVGIEEFCRINGLEVKP